MHFKYLDLKMNMSLKFNLLRLQFQPLGKQISFKFEQVSFSDLTKLGLDPPKRMHQFVTHECLHKYFMFWKTP